MADVGVLPLATPPSTGHRLIGVGVPRKEDDRLLRGEGQFTDDVERPHVVEMAVGRCPYPHARIVSVDASAAVAVDGVYDVLLPGDVAGRSEVIGIPAARAGRPAHPSSRPCSGRRHL